jgi:hypothetical protein
MYDGMTNWCLTQALRIRYLAVGIVNYAMLGLYLFLSLLTITNEPKSQHRKNSKAGYHMQLSQTPTSLHLWTREASGPADLSRAQDLAA